MMLNKNQALLTYVPSSSISDSPVLPVAANLVPLDDLVLVPSLLAVNPGHPRLTVLRRNDLLDVPRPLSTAVMVVEFKSTGLNLLYNKHTVNFYR